MVLTVADEHWDSRPASTAPTARCRSKCGPSLDTGLSSCHRSAFQRLSGSWLSPLIETEVYRFPRAEVRSASRTRSTFGSRLGRHGLVMNRIVLVGFGG